MDVGIIVLIHFHKELEGGFFFEELSSPALFVLEVVDGDSGIQVDGLLALILLLRAGLGSSLAIVDLVEELFQQITAVVRDLDDRWL